MADIMDRLSKVLDDGYTVVFKPSIDKEGRHCLTYTLICEHGAPYGRGYVTDSPVLWEHALPMMFDSIDKTIEMIEKAHASGEKSCESLKHIPDAKASPFYIP